MINKLLSLRMLLVFMLASLVKTRLKCCNARDNYNPEIIELQSATIIILL